MKPSQRFLPGWWPALLALTGLLFTGPLSAQTPAAITQVILNGGAAQRSTSVSIAMDFSTGVAASLRTEHLHLRNLTTGDPIAPLDLRLDYDLATRRAIWTFPALPAHSLPEGNYLAVLKADALIAPVPVRGPNTPGLGVPDFAFVFHCRFGDSEGDRDVDFLDTARFRFTWNQAAPAPEFDANLDGTVDATDLVPFRVNYFTFFPAVAAIHGSLLNDTGVSTSDGLTADPTIAGTVFRPNPGTTFRSALALAADPVPAPRFDTTADLTGDGTFTFSPQRLAQIKGSPLDPGAYRLHLETLEAAGERRNARRCLSFLS